MAPDGSVALSETEVNGKGPEVDSAALVKLEQWISSLNEGDVLILSGSLAPGMEAGCYASWVRAAKQRGAEVVVDTTGAALVEALPEQPLLIKPNNDEIAELAGCDPRDRAALIDAACSLASRGPRFVLVSCGGDGAFLVDAKGLVAQASAPHGTLVNSVGAGDSMVAGFVAGWTGQLSPAISEKLPEDPAKRALALGVACGSATAFSEGLATGAAIEALLSHVEVNVA